MNELQKMKMEELIAELVKLENIKLEIIMIYRKAAELDLRYIAAKDTERLIRTAIAAKING